MCGHGKYSETLILFYFLNSFEFNCKIVIIKLIFELELSRRESFFYNLLNILLI